MTEQEWLTSDDPAAMLDSTRGCLDISTISERKLRLFACAVERMRMLEYATPREHWLDRWEELEYTESHPDDPPRQGAVFQLPDAGRIACLRNGDTCFSQAGKADLLRDIIGDPFQPVTLPVAACRSCGGAGYFHMIVDGVDYGREQCGACRGVPPACSWLTPQVRDLALAAYEDRDRECEQCKGEGSWTFGLGGFATDRCLACGGNGLIADGTLDPFRLALLSDALEEAGCGDKVLLRHLRGWERCPCSMNGLGPSHGNEEMCGGRRWIGLPGPHVRGCWALDLLLEKE